MQYYHGGKYDVIVVGAGHAGCEAALAAARMGMETLLLTLNYDGIALMPCNPSIGGTGKGHLVREIDALGGQMGLSADATFLQMKMLNLAKGPAVQSLRAQMDKKAYQKHMRNVLEETDHLTIQQAETVQLLEKSGNICAVRTACGAQMECKALVLATGVYLESRIIIGEFSQKSGPAGFQGAYGLSQSLQDLGFSLRRFKTGTPARVDKRTIDFSKTTPQFGDAEIVPFSFLSPKMEKEQVPCYLTYTNAKTHAIIRQNLHRSPLYSGMIEGIGPRYCPSIEDKVVKFPEKERHQMFLEPEGLGTNEIYVQGMSSSLPEEVQIALYQTVPGMEKAKFIRPAYAIEYDCIDPTQLSLGLQARHLGGLFLAGQINGSSGYEEAAAQGIVAGINAAQWVKGQPPLVLGRDQAYAGVLIDDLVTKGTMEPYRMMTARAEYRLLLRQDNADERLTQLGRDVGLVSSARYDAFMRKQEKVRQGKEKICSLSIAPGPRLQAFFKKKGQPPAEGAVSLLNLIKRPGIGYEDLESMVCLPRYTKQIREKIQTDLKYQGYIEKQQRQVAQWKSLEEKPLDAGIDYAQISGLRLEAKSKLNQMKPENIGQASRISGVSPADIAVLLVYFEKRKGQA